jgi:hypothetical protein
MKYKFRALSIDYNDWVYGSLIYLIDEPYINQDNMSLNLIRCKKGSEQILISISKDIEVYGKIEIKNDLG